MGCTSLCKVTAAPPTGGALLQPLTLALATLTCSGQWDPSRGFSPEVLWYPSVCLLKEETTWSRDEQPSRGLPPNQCTNHPDT